MNIYSLLEFVCRFHDNFFFSSFSVLRLPDRWCAGFGFDAAFFPRFHCAIAFQRCFLLLFDSKHQIDHLTRSLSVTRTQEKGERATGKNSLIHQYSHSLLSRYMEMRVNMHCCHSIRNQKYGAANWMRMAKVKIENIFHLVSRLPRSLETHFQQWKLKHVSNGNWWWRNATGLNPTTLSLSHDTIYGKALNFACKT